MRRSNARMDQIPSFRNAADKRAWLLEQLAAVEKEALLEDMAAGTNERITIRAGEKLRIEVGAAVLYDGTDAQAFCDALAGMIDALPLGSVFMVEAGRGGKTLSGGSGADEAPEQEQAEAPAASRRSSRKSKGEEAG